MADSSDSTDQTITTVGSWLKREGEATTPEVYALIICWSFAEPERVGEVALVTEPRLLLGRGEPREDDPAPRLHFFRQRPGQNGATPPLAAKGISRAQLLIEATDHGLRISQLGRCPLLINRVRADLGTIRAGDTVELEDQLLLLCARRPVRYPTLRTFPHKMVPAFGAPDPFGMVGESPIVWALREELAVHARTDSHVLVFGASGTGKELAAQALHRLSSRAARPMISRNSATFPDTLIDAELFGNIKNYPNPGMPDRAGVIGEASGGSLFLDEIGEISADMQAHMLRILDGGEYHRLGEATSRRADLRVIAATNRQIWDLKHDFAARFPVRVTMPPVQDRREDIPLLLNHLVRMGARRAPDVWNRFIGENDMPRLEPRLIDHLLRHPFSLHVRELEEILTRAVAHSRHDFVSFSPPGQPTWKPGSNGPESGVIPLVPLTSSSGDYKPRRKPSRDEIIAVLEKHEGNQSKAWRELGLKNRFVLHRLLKKHGIAVAESGPEPEDDV